MFRVLRELSPSRSRLAGRWEPLHGLIGHLEKSGVVVVPLHDMSGLIDAVTLVQSGLPIIFYNPDAPGDRIRFTIAHEIGHHVVGESPDDEESANRFAAQLLMPDQAAAAVWKAIAPKLEYARKLSASTSYGVTRGFQSPYQLVFSGLLRAKQAWGVSIGSLLFRAGKHGLDLLGDQEQPI